MAVNIATCLPPNSQTRGLCGQSGPGQARPGATPSPVGLGHSLATQFLDQSQVMPPTLLSGLGHAPFPPCRDGLGPGHTSCTPLLQGRATLPSLSTGPGRAPFPCRVALGHPISHPTPYSQMVSTQVLDQEHWLDPACGQTGHYHSSLPRKKVEHRCFKLLFHSLLICHV